MESVLADPIFRPLAGQLPTGVWATTRPARRIGMTSIVLLFLIGLCMLLVVRMPGRSERST